MHNPGDSDTHGPYRSTTTVWCKGLHLEINETITEKMYMEENTMEYSNLIYNWPNHTFMLTSFELCNAVRQYYEFYFHLKMGKLRFTDVKWFGLEITSHQDLNLGLLNANSMFLQVKLILKKLLYNKLKLLVAMWS